MNEQNLDYLKKSLDYLGFDNALNDVLQSAISRELPLFSLGLSQSYKPNNTAKSTAKPADHLSFQLNFNRSKTTDMYFLNTYEVTLARDGKPPVKQVFDYDKDSRITALQAYRLLSGNAIEKNVMSKAEEGEIAEKKKVWFKLNLDVLDAQGNHPLRKFYPEYQFDLSAAIDKYPFKGLDEQKKEDMLRSLKMGARAKGIMLVNNRDVPVEVTANPQFRGLEVFDKNNVAMRQSDLLPELKTNTEMKDELGISETEEISTEEGEERFMWGNSQNAEPEVDHSPGR